jgi:hypothetical protein
VAYALNLPAALKARGLVVETVPGWETRSAGSLNAKGAVCHWTAGPRGSTTRPSLNICTKGRADLPGPLCNVYLDRRGVAVVVAAGRANHAGSGGWKGLTGNSAVFGTEAEASGASDFTAAQRWAYPRINAAYCDLGGFGPDMVCGHSEWAGPRKTDINGYPMAQMRADVAAVLAGTPTPGTAGGFLMALTDAQQQELYNKIVGAKLDYRNHHGAPGDDILGQVLSIRKEVAKLTPGVTNDHGHGPVYAELIKLTPGVAGVHEHGEVYRLLIDIQAAITKLLDAAAGTETT